MTNYYPYYVTGSERGWYFDDNRGNTCGPFSRPSLAEANAREQSKVDAEWRREHDEIEECACVVPEQSCPACRDAGRKLYYVEQAEWFGGSPGDYAPRCWCGAEYDGRGMCPLNHKELEKV